MKNSEIKKHLQECFDRCLWYGYVDTPLGVLREFDLHKLANNHGVKLTMNMAY